ncbi:PLDc N-terminal domain-containing protein [Natronococcus sp. A-GB1]|uniref:PLDc N-terminal domain-containing protein n=1 Tax=Natronococcus sp. A-GB1 TaxID=3037648 RepID=UPI00241EF72A|nr:PLDc N-terminal domain-containing protein [Natronococcus sp. A-GB1]MDG5758249.1 PLDc N-terminal domain-containing protein [Natronococcus sp. A-GB1]
MPVSLIVTAAVLWLFVSVWAALDARDHSSHDPLLWGLTVFFGGIAGILLYVNVGRDRTAAAPSETGVQTPELLECPNCRSKEVATLEQCRFCGERLGET